MAKIRIKTVTDFFGRCLREQGLTVSQIILFGSHARSEATDKSDIDIIVVSKDFEGKNIFEKAQLTKNAEIQTIKKYLIPVDIITLTPAELKDKTMLISEYAVRGKVMYAA